MADSVVHIDMEDVLASVRRLVAEDTPQDTTPEVTDDVCFVLTPEYRVAARNPDFRPEDDVSTDADAGVTDDDQPLELMQLLADVSRQTEDDLGFEPENGNEPESPVNFSAAEYQSMAEAWKKELASVALVTGSDEGDSADVFDPDDVTLEDRIAELEEAVSRSREDWEPDGSEPSKKPEIRRHIFEVVDNTTPTDAEIDREENDQAAEVQEPHLAETADEPVPAETPDVADDDGPLLLQPVFSHKTPDSEGPLVLVEKISPEAQAAEEIADITGSADDNVEKLAPRTGGKSEVVQEDDVFLDVEALRSMIGDLVREELRGKMGERITHNVRQMVRQEIDRVLLTRDDI